MTIKLQDFLVAVLVMVYLSYYIAVNYDEG